MNDLCYFYDDHSYKGHECYPCEDFYNWHLPLDNEDDKAPSIVTANLEKQETPKKIIQYVTDHNSLTKKYQLENVDNKASVTVSQEKVTTPVKIIRNIMDHKSLTKKHFALENVDNKASVTAIQENVATSVKMIRNVTDHKSLTKKHQLENVDNIASATVSQEKVVTPVKIIRNVMVQESFTKKHFTLENVDNKASVTSSQGKVMTAVKMIGNVTDHEILTKKHLSPDNAQVEASKVISQNQRKQSCPSKSIQKTTHHENFPLDNVISTKFGARTPVRHHTVIVSPKQVGRTSLNLTENTYKADKKYISTTSERYKMASNSDDEKQNFLTPNKTIAITSDFTMNTKESIYIGKEIQYTVVDNDAGRKISPKERRDNQKALRSDEFVKIPHPKVGEKNVSPAKAAKMSSNPYEMDKTIVSSAESNKMNITPDQLNRSIKVSVEKRKSPSPRRDTMLFRSMPRAIQSTGEIGIGIEIDIPFPSREKFSPTTSPISSTVYKSDKTITASIDKNESPKEMHFSVDVSKAGSSRDSSPSIIISSPMIVARKNSPNTDIAIPLGKDQLPYRSPKGSPSTSPLTLTSPRANNVYPNTMVYYFMQMNTIISLRDVYMRKIFNSLLAFQKDLEFLLSYLENIDHVLQNIPVVNKDYVTEEFKEYIAGLITMDLKLLNKFSSWKIEVDLDILYWTKCFQQILRIKSRNEPLISNGKPLTTFERHRVYEDELRTKWQRMDQMIVAADSRRALFLTTAHDLVKLVNLFINCLVTVGILKLSSESLL
ncbi:hypothetical protein HNY73_007294 [Argiope bruennichi]|uniref:Uncharacterized protein n=1 Tax=Argiope bruennichi TaxID=94029 RepID=A0A8T0FKI3_ARGBR|nr:hypothetical protein HNY73_007294 [Argiope bruennichi]